MAARRAARCGPAVKSYRSSALHVSLREHRGPVSGPEATDHLRCPPGRHAIRRAWLPRVHERRKSPVAVSESAGPLLPGTTRGNSVRSELQGGGRRSMPTAPTGPGPPAPNRANQGNEHVLGAGRLHHAAAEVAALGRQRAGAGVHDRVGVLPQRGRHGGRSSCPPQPGRSGASSRTWRPIASAPPDGRGEGHRGSRDQRRGPRGHSAGSGDRGQPVEHAVQAPCGACVQARPDGQGARQAERSRPSASPPAGCRTGRTASAWRRRWRWSGVATPRPRGA